MFWGTGPTSTFMASVRRGDKNDVSRPRENPIMSILSGAIFRLTSLSCTALFPQDDLLIQINFHGVWHGRCVGLR